MIGREKGSSDLDRLAAAFSNIFCAFHIFRIACQCSNDATISAFEGGGRTGDRPVAAVLGSCICTDRWEGGAGATGWRRGSAASQGGTGTYPLGDG